METTIKDHRQRLEDCWANSQDKHKKAISGIDWRLGNLLDRIKKMKVHQAFLVNAESIDGLAWKRLANLSITLLEECVNVFQDADIACAAKEDEELLELYL